MGAFLRIAALDPAQRGFALAAAALFGSMLVREQNNALKAIAPGLWQSLVAVIAMLGIHPVLREAARTYAAFTRFVDSRIGGLMVAGLILLLFFSRSFGMGALWHEVLDDAYQRVVKNAVEEGVELMAYVLITFASLAHCRSSIRRARRSGQRQDELPAKLDSQKGSHALKKRGGPSAGRQQPMSVHPGHSSRPVSIDGRPGNPPRSPRSPEHSAKAPDPASKAASGDTHRFRA